MTAEEWATATNVARMLRQVQPRATDRQLRLFASAWCRHYWTRLTDPQSRRAVEVAELYADKVVGDVERSDALQHARGVPNARSAHQISARVSRVAEFAVLNSPIYASILSVAFAASSAEDRALAPLHRCIFGNPFHPPFTVGPSVQASNDGAAIKLATVIYAERDPSTSLLNPTSLAILADALEEAGVDDRAALEHLRGPGPHVRGCHVIDALLGRS
jgi:hypothetical protein